MGLKARVLRSRPSCRRQGGRGRDREARDDSEYGIAERDDVELQTLSSHRAHHALCAADVPRAGPCHIPLALGMSMQLFPFSRIVDDFF